jgi:uncharacterized protein YhfF
VNARVIEELDRAKVPRKGEFVCVVDGQFFRTKAVCEIEAAKVAAERIGDKGDEVYRVKVIRGNGQEPLHFNVTRRVEYTASLLR